MRTAAEPSTPEAVAAWIDEAQTRTDRFADVRAASERHRLEHGEGCTVYPTSSGPLLGVVAAAIAARRVLEIGAGLGYSGLWLGSSGAELVTIERDPLHAELARANLGQHRARVRVIEGVALEVLPELEPGFDLAFCDADPRGYADLFDELVRLIRPGGVLVSANLFLGQFDPKIPHLEEIADYRGRIVADDRLQSALVRDGLAISVRSR